MKITKRQLRRIIREYRDEMSEYGGGSSDELELLNTMAGDVTSYAYADDHPDELDIDYLAYEDGIEMRDALDRAGYDEEQIAWFLEQDRDTIADALRRNAR